ncbi:MAG TPA: hypothetical protein PLJ78_16550 [Anaerolineae bacterium]|nr:hypothetical protein [Anaerolineae bacterium]HQK15543.1 hypothetical protein [Anaerolineae bacterium]
MAGILFSLGLFPVPSALRAAPSVWPAPTLLNPPDGQTATVQNYPPAAMPYFEWGAVPDATLYRIQIDDEIAFAAPIPYDVTTSNTRYIPTDNSKLVDGTVYWRVRVEKPTPVGDWSEIRVFTKAWSGAGNAPILLEPENGAIIEFFEAPVFSWSPVMGAADYVLKIDNDADCNSPSATYTTLTTSYNLSTRLANGTYYWCVTPRDPAGRNGLTSDVRQVTVQYAQTPQLLAPANGSTPTYTPTFRWTAVKGANAYRLQYSTDSSFAANLTTVTTNQTSYTPLDSLPNDKTYYWRVAAIYGTNYEGPYSEVWEFTKHWYQQPVLLTPRNNEQTNVPLFTWTPVREAHRYRFEASFDAGFLATIWPPVDTANTFHWQDRWDGDEWGKTIYWRVTPYDNSNNRGVSSEVKSFRPVLNTAMPENIWPRYFYTPPSTASGQYAPPYDIPIAYDYTMNMPTFYWSRTFIPAVTPYQEAAYYRLEVDDDPNFGSPEWTVLTENLSATPYEGNPFTPTASTNYYWRVTPYAANGTPLPSSSNSQPWMTQIDLARRPLPLATNAPMLRYPTHGEKVFATMPAFDWAAQQGAVRYELMVSADPNFGSTAYVTRTTYTRHTPIVRLPIGTYFWRVRGLDSSNNTVGEWSETRRLVVGMQTRWFGVDAYSLGTLPIEAATLMAADVEDGLGAAELRTLYAAQDKDYWFIGFHITPTLGTPVWYGLYLDANQTDGQGATMAPPDRPTLTTSSYYQPEYALYVTYNGATLVTDRVDLYTWSADALAWDSQVKNLVDAGEVGGALYYSATLGYVELKIPRTAIGDRGDKPFSFSAVLFSTTSNTASSASDTVPDNGSNPAVLNEFKTIGDRVTLAVPVGGLPEEDTALPYSPYLYAEAPNTDHIGGYRLEVARDPLFTSILQSLETRVTGDGYVDIFQYIYSTKSIYEDNTLYWRYAVRHVFNNVYYNSPPSEPHVFTKSGLIPGNLRIEGSYSTPRFIWDAVEGAANYRFELSSNPNFSPLLLQAYTNHENYTPLDAFKPGTYYWRVRTGNSFSAAYSSQWSLINTFNITLPVVSLVSPSPAGVVHTTPTFEWNAVVISGDTGMQGWSAPKYRLQVANNPNFSSPIEDLTLDTITWTPTKTYPDGDYYWRVAVVDANSQVGPFSGVYTFTKQYPVVTLVSPLPGTAVDADFPTFIWQPVDGAARYAIQVAANPQFSPLLDSATTNNTRFIPLKKYTTTQYYWRVAMIDKSGSYGPWTDSVLIDPYPYDVFLPLTVKKYSK